MNARLLLLSLAAALPLAAQVPDAPGTARAGSRPRSRPAVRRPPRPRVSRPAATRSSSAAMRRASIRAPRSSRGTASTGTSPTTASSRRALKSTSTRPRRRASRTASISSFCAPSSSGSRRRIRAIRRTSTTPFGSSRRRPISRSMRTCAMRWRMRFTASGARSGRRRGSSRRTRRWSRSARTTSGTCASPPRRARGGLERALLEERGGRGPVREGPESGARLHHGAVRHAARGDAGGDQGQPGEARADGAGDEDRVPGAARAALSPAALSACADRHAVLSRAVCERRHEARGRAGYEGSLCQEHRAAADRRDDGFDGQRGDPRRARRGRVVSLFAEKQ